LLLSGGSPLTEDTGFRVDLNVTDNGGYQDQSSFNRVSTTGRLDTAISDDIDLKTIVAFSSVDQSGVSGLEGDDYRQNTRKNRFHGDIGFREVYSLRVSSEMAYEPDGENPFTVTPFFRDDVMDLMPPWMVTFDPNVYKTQFRSYGMLAKYRHRFSSFDGELIAGIDVDRTPSRYQERQITVAMVGDVYVDHNFTGRTNYDFDANQTSVSPYFQMEWAPLGRVRLTGGLRFDYFHVDYQDNLSAAVPQQVGFRSWRRPSSRALSYDHFSPKFGLVVDLAQRHNAYANYRHAFRVPSARQLFRSGSSVNTADLDPVKSDSFEIGFRGQFFDRVTYDLALYHMTVRDDIVSLTDGADRKVSNAGETTHKGIEIGVSVDVTENVAFHSAWTFTKQEYEDFEAVVGFPARAVNFGGFDVARAPKSLGKSKDRVATYCSDWVFPRVSRIRRSTKKPDLMGDRPRNLPSISWPRQGRPRISTTGTWLSILPINTWPLARIALPEPRGLPGSGSNTTFGASDCRYGGSITAQSWGTASLLIRRLACSWIE
jgi:iron complex outermembrane recepter protein